MDYYDMGPGENKVRSLGEAARPKNSTAWRDEGAARPDEESFNECLNRLLRRSGLSLTALSRRSWLDISYVSRLVNLPYDPLNPRAEARGDKRHPSRDTVIRLGLAMQLSMADMNELLLSAGYAPLVR